MHDDRQLIEGRLERTLQRIEDAVWSTPAPAEVASWEAPGEPVPVSEGLAAAYTPATVGDRWGAPWGTTWFRVRATVPQAHSGRPVDLRLDLGFDPDRTGFHVEGLVYRADGSPVKGLNPRNQWVRVADSAAGGEEVELFVEAASNPLLLGGGGFDFRPSPLGDPDTAGREARYRIERAELAVFEEDVWELQQDLEVLGQLAAELEVSDARRWQVLRAIDRSLDLLDVSDIAGTAAAARGELGGVLKDPARASAHRLSAVGHAHIDSAWLWPVRETVRKVARTCSNVGLPHGRPPRARLRHVLGPAVRLAQGAPPRGLGPGEVGRCTRAASCPWAACGSSPTPTCPAARRWPGSSYHGKRFFLDEFGIETQRGVAARLLRLHRRAAAAHALSGSQWFLTQKISWNTDQHASRTTSSGGRASTAPASSPTSRRSTPTTPSCPAASWRTRPRNFADKGAATHSLLPFGWGDGGGGPTREMVAPGGPPARPGGLGRGSRSSRPTEFFEQPPRRSTRDAPVWVGRALPRDAPRPRYTSQAKTKQGNRRSEHLLREAELWAAAAAVAGGLDAYPYEDLDRIWKAVLLNQFHDILPGTSIAWVHREAEATYAGLAEELEAIIGQGPGRRWPAPGQVRRSSSTRPARPGRRGRRSGPAPLVEATPTTVRGEEAARPGQRSGDPRRGRRARAARVGGTTPRPAARCSRQARRATCSSCTRTPRYQLDAWDVDAYYTNNARDLTDVDSVESSAVDGGATGRAAVVRRVRCHPDGAARGRRAQRVDIETDGGLARGGEDPQGGVRPVDVHADRSASEIAVRAHLPADPHQHEWDAAKFEIARTAGCTSASPGTASRWSTTRPTATTSPGATAQGGGTTTHGAALAAARARRAPTRSPTWASTGPLRLVPGAGMADAVREGYRVNLPLRRVRGSGAPVEPLVVVDGDGVLVESRQARRRRVGRRRGAPLRGTGSASRRPRAGGVRAQRRVCRGPPRAPTRDSRRGRRGSRRGGPGAAALPDRHPPLPPGLTEPGPRRRRPYPVTRSPRPRVKTRFLVRGLGLRLTSRRMRARRGAGSGRCPADRHW